MNLQRTIKSIIYLTVLAWTIALFVNGEPVHSSFLKPLSTTSSIVICAAMAFDLYFWKWRIFRWLVKRPVIEGTWAVEMVSDWRDPETGAGSKTIKGFMIIRQTLTNLSMRQLTAESSSALVGTELVCAPDGMYCVSGVYRNEPVFEFRLRSPIHYGAISLNVAEDESATTIAGHYWTDRKTGGTIALTKLTTEKYQSFASARSAFPEAAGEL
jgi:hypothetical protein